MDITNNPHKVFTQEEAAQLAAELNDGDDGWTYKAINNPDPAGPKTAIIKIYNEAGEFVANL